MPCFRTCSTCGSRSQAPLCHCTRRLIANQSEGTFGRLRYSLGGDRPSQTAHLTRSRTRIHGSRLELQHRQGGISRTPPGKLALPFRRLPPILHNRNQSSTSSYSKGPRGLSVLMQLTSIFTRTSISPGLWLRQWGSRYAIRAGRNLPDKEFRYLSTVIVTAAVYRGLGSELRPCGLTPPRNLPAPGRRHSVYIVLATWHAAVFLVNSRFPLVCDTPSGSGREALHPTEVFLIPKLRK